MDEKKQNRRRLQVIDRRKKKVFVEKIHGLKPLVWLYRENFLSRLFCFLAARLPFFSWLYGLWHKSFFTKSKILPFVQKYHINASEFVKEPKEFASFNDFFIRKLKTSCRPLAARDAVLPADARYLAFESLANIGCFFVKEKQFDLASFLKDRRLAEKYRQGSMLIARLAPVDCHRFYFPADCIAEKSKIINGHLYSVNPLAMQGRVRNFLENKRVLTVLKTEKFKEVLFIEIGATNVGSIVQTYQPMKPYRKGAEKGYFSLGGSALVLLFEKNTVRFDRDLVQNTTQGLETYARLGDSLGSCVC